MPEFLIWGGFANCYWAFHAIKYDNESSVKLRYCQKKCC